MATFQTAKVQYRYGKCLKISERSSISDTCLQIVFVAVTTSLWPRLHALPSFPRRRSFDPVSLVSFGAQVTET